MRMDSIYKNSSEKQRRSSFQPWVEKYRPRTLNDISYQEEAIKLLNASVKENHVQHLLFYGPPGTGKTTTALAIGKKLFGSEYKNRVLELNASDDRGIYVVRNKIRNFTRLTVAYSNDLPTFKLLILDEADFMTRDAQNALKRTMEVYSNVTRFCFICNYVTRIIEPIASRCLKFNFSPIPLDALKERVYHICSTEDIKINENELAILEKVSRGDMRKAITTLQTCARLYGNINSSDGILDVAGYIPQELISEFISMYLKGLNYGKIIADKITDNGYSILQFLIQLLETVLDDDRFNEKQKAKICYDIGICEKGLNDGLSEIITLSKIGFSIWKYYETIIVV